MGFGYARRSSYKGRVGAEVAAAAAGEGPKSAGAASTLLLLSSGDPHSSLSKGASTAPHSTRRFITSSTGTNGGSIDRPRPTGSKLLCSTEGSFLLSATGAYSLLSIAGSYSLRSTFLLSKKGSTSLRSPLDSTGLRSNPTSFPLLSLALLSSRLESSHNLSLNSLLTSPHSNLTSPTDRSSVSILHLLSSSFLASPAAALERYATFAVRAPAGEKDLYRTVQSGAREEGRRLEMWEREEMEEGRLERNTVVKVLRRFGERTSVRGAVEECGGEGARAREKGGGEDR